MIFAGLPLAAVITLTLVTVAAVVTLYLLKSTPRRQLVSNADFWAKAVEQAKPAWIFSHRVPILALLVTLLAALLIIAVAADPRLQELSSTTTVVVIDAGRSMEAGPRERRRFDLARAELEAIAAQSTRTGQLALVRAGVRPSLLVPLTRDPRAVERALAVASSVDQGPSDLDGAVALADSIMARRSGTDAAQIILISDRSPTTTTIHAPMRVQLVGAAAGTVAITAFEARRDPTALGEYAIYCVVQAFTRNPAQARLVIRDRDVVLLDEELELEANQPVERRARGFASGEAEVTARLEAIRIEDGDDGLDADDSAYAVVPSLARTRVLIVTGGNRYLEQVFRVNPSVEADRTTPAQLDAEGAGGYDVVVLDQHLPPGGLQGLPSALVIGPPERREGLRLGASLRDVEVSAALSTHPVLDAVALEDVRFRQARELLPEPEDRPLLRSDRQVIATARDVQGARQVVLGFRLDQTNLVEQPAFPLLMHNAVVWLANQQSLSRSSRHPGEPLAFAGQRAEVETPAGERRLAQGGLFFETGRAGIYRIDDRPFAYSSVDHAGALGMSTLQSRPTKATSEPPLTLILGVILLAILALEWLLLHRGRV
jgi:Ca-activated chloride channel homolog